jgi:dihydroorotate dehydrogenase (fumarate)
MFLCGANAVQIGTCHWTEGPKCFDRIVDELQQIMTSKGYKSLDEIIGKLKPWSKEGAAISRAAAKNKKGQSTTALSKTTAGNGPSLAGLSNSVSILDCVLIVIIAFLLAEKFDLVKLL